MKYIGKYIGQPDWLTIERIRGYSILCIVLYSIAIVVMWTGGDGLRDPVGHPIGTDFLDVYAAGLMAQQGQAAAAYDWAQHGVVERQVIGFDAPYYGWHYPPMFFGVAMILAFLPYLWALGCYLVAGFVAYMAMIRQIIPEYRLALLAAAAFSGVFINIGNGQNGFITTALLGSGLICLERNPYRAGLLLGLLVYKPQFFILIPFSLLCGGYLRASIATVVVAMLSMAASYVMLGRSVWEAFFTSTHLTREILLEQGASGWNRVQSVFSIVRMAGGGTATAYTIHGLVALAGIAILAITWQRSSSSLATRASALVAAALLVTPYVNDYDLMVLAIPIAYLARQGCAEGFRPYEQVLLVSLWVLPLIAKLVGSEGLILTPFVLMALLTACYRRSRTI